MLREILTAGQSIADSFNSPLNFNDTETTGENSSKQLAINELTDKSKSSSTKANSGIRALNQKVFRIGEQIDLIA